MGVIKEVMSYIYDLLNFKVQIVPVISIYLSYLLIIKIREQLRFKYASVYCSLPVFRNSGRLENFFMNEVDNINEEIIKVKKDCFTSYVIDSTVIPIVIGILLGWFNINKDIFYTVLVLIVLKRIVQFSTCFIEIIKEQLLSKKDTIRLFVFYGAFIVIMYRGMTEAYTLTSTDVITSVGYYFNKIFEIVSNYMIAWIGIPTDLLSTPLLTPESELDIDEDL